MAHILIGFAEALPAPEVVFSLRAAGHDVSAFARRADLPLRHLPLAGLHVLPDPAHDVAGACSVLQALLAGADAPDLILPLDDEGLWLIHAALPGDPRALCASDTHVAIALDKTRQVATAREAGLAVLPTVVIGGRADLEAVVDFTLPAIVKPALALEAEGSGLAKGAVHYLMTPDDLTALVADLPETCAPMLMQPLVGGVGEGVFGFATSGGVVAWSGHRRLRMMNPHGSGSSACQSLAPDEAIKAAITRFMVASGWRGPFMMEFLRDAEGTPWFMELNGRMWGSLALARRQGFEYPVWSVEAGLMAGFVPDPPSLPKDPLTEPVTVRHLGRDLLHLLFTLRGPKTDLHRDGWPRFGASLAAVLRPGPARLMYNYDPAHRGYLWRDALWTLRKALKR